MKPLASWRSCAGFDSQKPVRINVKSCRQGFDLKIECRTESTLNFG
jgi:hypothetical protein